MQRWILRKKFTFEAAHRLPNHEGVCRRLHGHSFVGYLTCSGTMIVKNGPETGMLLDYGTMKAAIDPLLRDHLDHYLLNESLDLQNPTSEEICRWIYRRVKEVLPSLTSVRIDETCTSECEYSE